MSRTHALAGTIAVGALLALAGPSLAASPNAAAPGANTSDTVTPSLGGSGGRNATPGEDASGSRNAMPERNATEDQGATSKDDDENENEETGDRDDRVDEGWMGHHRMRGMGSMMGGMPGSTMGRRDRREGHERGMWGPRAMCEPVRHLDGKLAFVRAELHITDAQGSQWQSFETAVRSALEQRTKDCAKLAGEMATPAASLPDRLGRMEAHLRARLDMLQQVQKALQPLYASLDDGQKREADRMIARRLDLFPGGMHRHDGHDRRWKHRERAMEGHPRPHHMEMRPGEPPAPPAPPKPDRDRL